MRLGFLGLGVMGTPMALNLARRFPLTVWNRTSSKYEPLRAAGANIGATPSQTIEQSDIIIAMLFDQSAIQSLLSDDFKKALHGKTLVNTSSVSAEFSQYLAKEVHEAGGNFIEMPVSGSRIPAEKGQLVGLIAGDQAVVERIKPFLDPIISKAIYCGPIGSGLKTKFALNLYLLTMTAGLAESVNLAQAQGLDLHAFQEALGAGPMASAHSHMKIDKMIRGDWSPQAAIQDCANNTQLIVSAAKQADIESPLIQLCSKLYKQAASSGFENEDMIAVAKVLSKKRAE
ncbi:hypothetical protein BX600DRAFT_470434 [Xylariales sp. PMI_506]|nr:hypothetical protein BX600DRAFT_470434 [Xylariales sp. PMI_506]